MTLLQLNDVCFAYSTDEVIQDVSVTIQKGDYVGIVGPNGGGKSTLLKIMLGLLEARSGTVRLFGSDVKHFKEWSRIGYVPQRTHVETMLPVTVEEMVAMGRYGKRGLLHFPTKEDKEKTLSALEKVGMLEYRKRQFHDLSGGQQQRVIIARALACEPEIIFLDEPTVGVDVKTQKQFYALLRKLNTELHLTLILVTHELDIVAHEANKLIYINRTIEYSGEPSEFLQGKYFHELIGKGGLHH